MTCIEVKELLDEFVSGELDEKKEAEISAHLEGCPDCKREMEELKAMKESLGAFVKDSERSLADSVMSEIRKELYPVKRLPFIARHIGLAASLVVIVALFAFSSLERRDGKSAPELNGADLKFSTTGEAETLEGSFYAPSVPPFELEEPVEEELPSAEPNYDVNREFVTEDGIFIEYPAESPSTEELKASKDEEHFFVSSNLTLEIPVKGDIDEIKALAEKRFEKISVSTDKIIIAYVKPSDVFLFLKENEIEAKEIFVSDDELLHVALVFD